MSSYSDSIRDEITGHFIAALEKGDIPWHRPWNGVNTLPHNWTTGKQYRGMFNPIYLMMVENSRGFGDSRWGGKGQILKAGGRILRDEFSKPTKILAPLLKPTGEVDANGKPKLECRGWRVVKVWNAAQCEGVPVIEEVEPVDPSVGFEKAAALSAASGADIKHGGNVACYSPIEDNISLPKPGAFKSVSHYWSTHLHELGHWTGHQSRLSRKGITAGALGKTRETYAFEELVAEMSSAMLCHTLGIDAPELMEGHEAYINNWIRTLKSDPKALQRAGSQAQKAMDYLLKNVK